MVRHRQDLMLFHVNQIGANMRYIDFKDSIHTTLRRHHSGLTWPQLKQKLNLPYARPCPTWLKSLEGEIGLTRSKESGRARIWRIGEIPCPTPKPSPKKSPKSNPK